MTANSDVIQGWMSRGCGSNATGLPGLLALDELLYDGRKVNGEAIEVHEPSAFGLVSQTPEMRDLEPVGQVMQWIEGTFFGWEEYSAPSELCDADGLSENADGGSAIVNRVVRLLEPENRGLDRDEAAVFLSASLLWMESTTPTAPELVDAEEATDTPNKDAPGMEERQRRPDRSVEFTD